MQDDQDLARIRDEFVRPYYLSLLHGNFSFRPDQDTALRARIVESARAISDAHARLFDEREWRGRLTAAWFVGLARRPHFVEHVAELLLTSEQPYAGQGYCLALGLIGGPTCEKHLRKYLDTYLPLNGRWYDQAWAIGALAHLRGEPPREYLDAMLRAETDGRGFDPTQGIEAFDELVGYLRRHRMIDSPE